MTEKEFFDKLLLTYSEEISEDLPGDGLGYYLEYFLDNYPPEKLELPATKKIAARIIHEFMINVLGWQDQEWQEAANLKDIYDCRVCSNAIAQVYVRGIIGEANPQVFGLNNTLSEQEGQEIINKRHLHKRGSSIHAAGRSRLSEGEFSDMTEKTLFALRAHQTPGPRASCPVVRHLLLCNGYSVYDV